MMLEHTKDSKYITGVPAKEYKKLENVHTM